LLLHGPGPIRATPVRPAGASEPTRGHRAVTLTETDKDVLEHLVARRLGDVVEPRRAASSRALHADRR